jgi:hypothetical protein
MTNLLIRCGGAIKKSAENGFRNRLMPFMDGFGVATPSQGAMPTAQEGQK